MMEPIIIISFSCGLLIENLCGGYRMDEQISYPHDGKHSMIVPKKLKKFVFLNRTECLRTAFIIEIVGYIEFLISIIFLAICLILNYYPEKELIRMTFGIIMMINGLYVISISIYYRIKFKG